MWRPVQQSGMAACNRGRQSIWRVVGPTMLVSAILIACGHSAHDVEVGWQRALQMDLEAEHAAWYADTNRTAYPSNASAMRALQNRYARVYARSGIDMDPVSQGLLAYSVALWTRVDQQQVSWDDARRLQDGIVADVAQARPKLPALADSAKNRSTLAGWWTTNWETHRARYQVTGNHPIECRTGAGQQITCE